MTLFSQVEIKDSSVLQQYKHQLHRLSTETLRGIAHQLLTDLNVDSHHTLFHTDVMKNSKKAWRELTPEITIRRDQATRKRHQQSRVSKQRREDFEDIVESRLHGKRRT